MKGKTLTAQEAGHKGGLTTRQRHGRQFYEAMGKKGGDSEAAKCDHGISRL